VPRTDVPSSRAFILSTLYALTLKVGGLQRKLTARFDPTNHTDERGTRLDLEGGRFVERSSWFRPTLGRFLGTR
jgi:hypothetical protein